MTLIEVVAALALLASLLVSLLLTKTHADRQAVTAQRKLQAITLADQLLATFSAETAPLRVPNSGHFPNSTLTWHTELVPNPTATQLLSRVIRLQLIDPSTNATPLLTVEFLDRLPQERPR